MRILYINVICKHGSTGKITYDLYTQCKDDGHEAVVCYGRGPKLKEPDVYKFGLDWETNVHALLTRLTGVNGCWSFFSTRRLLINLSSLLVFLFNQKTAQIYGCVSARCGTSS